MTGVTGLRGLLAKATPGPWRWATDEDEDGILYAEVGIGDQVFATYPDTARLIALCPDAVALLCDMADYVERDVVASAALPRRDALLARFAELEERAR